MYSLDGRHPSAYRPPGYPYLLAALRELNGSVFVLRCLNVVFLAVAVWAAWWLARAIGGRAAATLTAPAVALYPIGFYTMGALYPQTMGMALLLVGLMALASIPGRSSIWWRAIGAGVAFGLLIVTIPTFLLALLLGAVWLVWRTRKVGPAVLIVSVAAVLPLAWTIRNAAEMHHFIPVSTNNGINLVLGNSPHAGPRTGVDADISQYTRVIQQRHLGEIQSDSYLRTAALDWVKGHPARAGRLYAEKTLNYFAPYDRLGTDSQNSGAQQALAASATCPCSPSSSCAWFVGAAIGPTSSRSCSSSSTWCPLRLRRCSSPGCGSGRLSTRCSSWWWLVCWRAGQAVPSRTTAGARPIRRPSRPVRAPAETATRWPGRQREPMPE